MHVRNPSTYLSRLQLPQRTLLASFRVVIPLTLINDENLLDLVDTGLNALVHTVGNKVIQAAFECFLFGNDVGEEIALVDVRALKTA